MRHFSDPASYSSNEKTEPLAASNKDFADFVAESDGGIEADGVVAQRP